MRVFGKVMVDIHTAARNILAGQPPSRDLQAVDGANALGTGQGIQPLLDTAKILNTVFKDGLVTNVLFAVAIRTPVIRFRQRGYKESITKPPPMLNPSSYLTVSSSRCMASI